MTCYSGASAFSNKIQLKSNTDSSIRHIAILENNLVNNALNVTDHSIVTRRDGLERWRLTLRIGNKGELWTHEDHHRRTGGSDRRVEEGGSDSHGGAEIVGHDIPRLLEYNAKICEIDRSFQLWNWQCCVDFQSLTQWVQKYDLKQRYQTLRI